MYNYKITIIMAVYNRVNKVEQAISSVVNQSYRNIEFIIIDGGSTDGTVDIIKKYEDKIAYWISEPDKGIYDAFSKGVKIATGDYIEFIGSDDSFYSNDVIEKIVNQIEVDTDIIAGTEYTVNGDKCLEKLLRNESVRDKNTYIGGMSPHAAMFARRELFNKYPFDTSYKIAGDYKFFLQCYIDSSITFKFVDTPVAYFENGGVSNSARDIARKEDDRIYKELNLQYTSDRKGSVFREGVKDFLRAIHLFEPVRDFIDENIRWKKHHCSNKICRWCGRGV